MALELGVVIDIYVSAFEIFPQRTEALHDKCRMRLPRGAETRLNAKMEIDRGPFEPAAAPREKVRWLWNLIKAQQLAIERPCGVLLARRYCYLQMMQGHHPARFAFRTHAVLANLSDQRRSAQVYQLSGHSARLSR